MSDKVSIFYTIAKYDPRSADDQDDKVADINAYLGLISRLQADSRQKLNNILLGMARQLEEHRVVKSGDCSGVYLGIKSLFIDDSFDAIADNDCLYLVERITAGDKINTAPLDVWTVDTRVFKGMLTKNLYLSGMDEADISRVESKYRLWGYANKIRLGGFDDSEAMEYVKKYNYYLSEFYKRSDSPKRRVLVGYLRKAKRVNELVCYNDKRLTTSFEFDMSTVGTLKQVKSRITEFAEDMAFYAERMYQTAYGEDALKSTTGKGKSHYKEKFKIYDKCIQIYDRYKDVVSANESIDDDKFGVKIDIIEGNRGLPERKRLDRRKDIRKHYKLAVELIKQSTQGYLS